VPALTALLSGGEANDRARALWVLDRLGGEARKIVEGQLKHSDPAFRALAVRILRRHGAAFAEPILSLQSDPSSEVRREVLLALRTLSGEQAEAALAKIAATYDGSDRYQLEAINIAAGTRQAALLARLEKHGPLPIAQFPLLQLLNPSRAADQLLARLARTDLDEKTAKLVLENAVSIPSSDAGWGLLKLAENAERPAALRRSALEKVVANLDRRGAWTAMAADDRFITALGTLLNDDEMRTTTLTAIGRLHITRLSGQVMALAESPQLDPLVRAQAIDVAARLKPSGVSTALRRLLSDPKAAVTKAALRGIVDSQDIRTLRDILSGDKFPPELRARAAERLVDSTGGAMVLLRLIDENQLAPDLKQAVVAKAVAHPDSNVRVLYEKFIPETERPQKLGKAIAAEEILALSGDPNRGRVIFNKSSAAQCKTCHAVQGFGGTLGPDLSQIGKKYERKTLLETIVAPSKAIAPEFIPYLLETKEGQVHAGFLVERDADHVALKDVKSQLIRVATCDIEALVPQPKSLMPELVLSEVTAQDAADLLAFLTTLK
jgi:putative heme-binding domain-containing protein